MTSMRPKPDAYSEHDESGYVPWWNEYPGMHIPAPLELGTAAATNIRDHAKEIRKHPA